MPHVCAVAVDDHVIELDAVRTGVIAFGLLEPLHATAACGKYR